jgi:putative endonuclease
MPASSPCFPRLRGEGLVFPRSTQDDCIRHSRERGCKEIGNSFESVLFRRSRASGNLGISVTCPGPPLFAGATIGECRQFDYNRFRGGDDSKGLCDWITASNAGVQGAGEPCHHGGMQPCVYILASRRNGTLYVGVTSDLSRRTTEDKTDVIDGFTKRYRIHRLVYVEFHPTMGEAILHESALRNGGEPGNSS